jgi:hypothetical protein
MTLGTVPAGGSSSLPGKLIDLILEVLVHVVLLLLILLLILLLALEFWVQILDAVCRKSRHVDGHALVREVLAHVLKALRNTENVYRTLVYFIIYIFSSVLDRIHMFFGPPGSGSISQRYGSNSESGSLVSSSK